MVKQRFVRGGLGVVLALIGVLTAGTASAGVTPSADPVQKFGRGIANTATGILELPLAIHRVNQRQGPFAAVFVGTLQGIGAAVTRTSVGLLEVATFPFPLQGIGYAPIVNPEYLLERDSTL